MSPFKALYGYDAPRVMTYIPGSTADATVDDESRTRDELLNIMKRNLQVAQARMKMQYDKHHSERTFVVGDWVYLKLQPYKQQFVQKRAVPKLASHYYGPYQITEKIGAVAYKLKLLSTAEVQSVFHVSLLKKKVGNDVSVTAHLRPNLDPHSPHWYPAKILQRGLFKKENGPVTKWLVQWLGGTEEEATWEEADELLKRFPDFVAK
ncbi:uncharacterized protein LOC126795770 [Argentina anserina]|uniref:uncharacterized protein LOC126795770 n=1 Tax=Argentina anserina TaxID=57926 RepID=UPI0021765172|nr:uncharacterized protein LOC126795770 [Potentilla anserina]